MRRKKAMIIGGAALVAVAAAVLLLGGGKDKAAGSPAGGPRGGAMSANVPVVKAVNPTRGDIRLTSGLTGTVEPADVVYVYAKASGDVTAVMVKAGDTVTAARSIPNRWRLPEIPWTRRRCPCPRPGAI